VKIDQWTWAGGIPERAPSYGEQLVLVFGVPLHLETTLFETILGCYPAAHILIASTAGEIVGTRVLDDSAVVTAVELERSQLRVARATLVDPDGSDAVGRALAAQLPPDGLRHVLVLSVGHRVNGSALARGLAESLPPGIQVTGGLAGDGSRFQRTLVGLDGPPVEGLVAVVGFYGAALRIGCGSLGGWDPFGPERIITRARGNVLYELDGRPALDLYREYLGEHAAGLPASGLLFPLSLRGANGEIGIVRTLLAIDETERAIAFAGDMPEGVYARLMKANFDRLIDGAQGAARRSSIADAQLALLISCVGRKLVLKQRIEEEVEAVRDVLGPGVVLAGFYSYGEISPFTPSATCELHNQTMTITTLAEDMA